MAFKAFKNFYFIFWLCGVFSALCGRPLVVASGASLRRSAQASRCVGFSTWSTWARSLPLMAHELRRSWHVEPVSPELAGRFLSTAPLGKSSAIFWIEKLFTFFWSYLEMPLVMSFKILVSIDVLFWREAVEGRGEKSFRSPRCESGPHCVDVDGRLASLGVGLGSYLL